jgi:hypothetical protein
LQKNCIPKDCYPENGTVLRAISSSFLSLLLLATLLWGGCVSCPQFFMFPKAEKDCCNKAGQCERPSKTAPVKECKRMPVETHGFASVHAELAAAVPATAPEALVPSITVRLLPSHADSPQLEPSPPDLNVLNSTFLI